MLTEQTKELVSRFFAVLGEGEENIEQIRQHLNNCEDFDPYRLFNRLDQFRNDFINEQMLINFAQLNQIDATINQGKYVILFYDCNGDHTLNYNEFLGLVIGKGFYEKRDNEMINENNTNYLSYETEKIFCELLKASFEFVSALDSILADIKSYGDFSVSELLNQISNNGLLNSNNLKIFLQKYNKNLNDNQIEGLCRRLDLKKNGRIDMSDLERIFYFPYSSPPSNAASRANSFNNYSKRQINNNNNVNFTENSEINSQQIPEKNIKDNQKIENQFNSSDFSENNMQSQNMNFQNQKKMNIKKNLQIDTSNNNNPLNENSNFNMSNTNFNKSYNFNMSNNSNLNMSNKMNKNYGKNSGFINSQSTRFDTSPLKQNIKVNNYQQQRINTDFNNYKMKNPFENNINKNQIEKPNYLNNQKFSESNQFNISNKNYIETEPKSPNRISKTLALRLSPSRNKQQRMDNNFSDNEYNTMNDMNNINNNYNEDQFSERDFICFLKALIDIECNIECQKCCITRHPDFNIEDIFLIFETPRTQNNILSFSDLKNGFRSINLCFTDDELNLLISRFDLDNNNGICYSDFFDMLVPFDKCRRDDVERRIPNGLCNSTINELRCIFQLLLNSEKNLEDIRRRIVQMKGFDLQEIYNQEIDQFGQGLANNEEVNQYLNRKGLNCNQKGSDLLFIRLDRNRDGKVGYEDILNEMTPNNKK